MKSLIYRLRFKSSLGRQPHTDYQMKNQSKKVASIQKTPIYTKFGIAIIVMLVSIYIFNPDILLKGTVSLVTGLVFIIISIINLIRRIEYDIVTILVGIYLLITGANTFFSLELSYIPIVTILLITPVIFLSFKSKKKK